MADPTCLIHRDIHDTESDVARIYRAKRKESVDWDYRSFECNCRPHLTIWLFIVSLIFSSHNSVCNSREKKKRPCRIYGASFLIIY